MCGPLTGGWGEEGGEGGEKGLWLEGGVLQFVWWGGVDPPKGSWGQTHIWGCSIWGRRKTRLSSQTSSMTIGVDVHDPKGSVKLCAKKLGLIFWRQEGKTSNLGALSLFIRSGQDL